VTVVVAGGGAVAIAATSGDGTTRRIATVNYESVTQTIDSSGSIASSEKATPSFSVSGTVKSVEVKVGDKVSKGQALARLDTTSLKAAIYTSASTLATAKQLLETDETGQTSTGSSASGTGTGTGTATPSSYDTSTGSNSASVQTVADLETVGTGSSSLTALVKQIIAAQAAVVGGQRKVDAAQTAVDTAQKVVNADVTQNTKFRDAQQTACAVTTDPPPPASSTASTGPTGTPPSSQPTDGPTTQPTDPPPPPVSAACASAMANYEAFAGTLSTDTTTVNGTVTAQDTALDALQTGIGTLDKLIGKLQATASSGGSTGGGGSGTTTKPGSGSGSGTTKSGSGSGSGTTKSGAGSGSGTSGQGNSGTSNSAPPNQGNSGGSASGQGNSGTANSGQSNSGSANSGQSGSGSANSGQSSQAAAVPASAAQLAADQAAIDSAQAGLGVAQQNLAAATLTSPMSGSVAAVGLTSGTSASGQTITIVGTGVQSADVAVSLGEIDLVKVGEPATVAADGVTTKLHGTVRSVGILSTTSGSSTTFPVTIDLDADSPAVSDGTGADVVITGSTANHVLAVPNSAIHTTVNGRHSVTVVDGNKTSTVAVTIGTQGSDRTQIKSGLKAGDKVMLADLSQPLPSSSTSSNTGTLRFPAGFGGGQGVRGGG